MAQSIIPDSHENRLAFFKTLKAVITSNAAALGWNAAKLAAVNAVLDPLIATYQALVDSENAVVTANANAAQVFTNEKADLQSLIAELKANPGCTDGMDAQMGLVTTSTKPAPDGTGTFSSRRFGYTKPGDRIGPAVGCGAYTEIISWPFSWESLGGGELDMHGEGKPTSTGPNYAGESPLALQSARVMDNSLVLYYTSGASDTFQVVDPKAPRLNPSLSEIKHRVAMWADGKLNGPQAPVKHLSEEEMRHYGVKLIHATPNHPIRFNSNMMPVQ